MLIEASWVSTHDIGTYGFRQVQTSSPGPTHIILSEQEFQMWLAVRGYRATANQIENLNRPKTFLSMGDVAEKTDHKFDIYLREVLSQIFLLATTEDGRQHEIEYKPDVASLETCLLHGIALPAQSNSDLISLHDWTKLLSYDPKAMKLSSSTMPSSMPEARAAQAEMMKKKHLPLWYPRTLCISLN
jgi:hypothetical protein